MAAPSAADYSQKRKEPVFVSSGVASFATTSWPGGTGIPACALSRTGGLLSGATSWPM